MIRHFIWEYFRTGTVVDNSSESNYSEILWDWIRLALTSARAQ